MKNVLILLTVVLVTFSAGYIMAASAPAATVRYNSDGTGTITMSPELVQKCERDGGCTLVSQKEIEHYTTAIIDATIQEAAKVLKQDCRKVGI